MPNGMYGGVRGESKSPLLDYGRRRVLRLRTFSELSTVFLPVFRIE